jgi:2-succinyl-6-hydroxy-2,4-cyclohexadiene-1-carboxylate synthase
VRRLLLHGFTGSPAMFDGVAGTAPELPGHGLAPELPGHGLAPDATSWDAAVTALLASMNEGSFVLGGYSMGARLALAIALRAPERIERLVLESGSPGLALESDRAARRAADEELAQVLEREGIDAFLRRWEQHPVLSGQPHAKLREARRSHRADGLASALRHLGQGSQPSLWDELPRLRVPTLLIAGERDEKYVAIARRMQERLPRAELQIVRGAGHAPHLEQQFDWRNA